MTLKGRATEKQKDFLLALGYTGDVEALSKAQASLIIDKLVEQRDEREGRGSKTSHGSYAISTSFGCVTILLAVCALVWLLGARPWEDEPTAQVVMPAPQPSQPAEPQPESKPLAVAPPDPVSPADNPDVDPSPTQIPAKVPSSEVERKPIDPRVHVFVDATGQFRIEARLKSYANGVATLVKEDGTEIKVPLNKLSDESARWIRNVFGLPKSADDEH